MRYDLVDLLRDLVERHWLRHLSPLESFRYGERLPGGDWRTWTNGRAKGQRIAGRWVPDTGSEHIRRLTFLGIRRHLQGGYTYRRRFRSRGRLGLPVLRLVPAHTYLQVDWDFHGEDVDFDEIERMTKGTEAIVCPSARGCHAFWFFVRPVPVAALRDSVCRLRDEVRSGIIDATSVGDLGPSGFTWGHDHLPVPWIPGIDEPHGEPLGHRHAPDLHWRLQRLHLLDYHQEFEYGPSTMSQIAVPTGQVVVPRPRPAARPIRDELQDLWLSLVGSPSRIPDTITHHFHDQAIKSGLIHRCGVTLDTVEAWVRRVSRDVPEDRVLSRIRRAREYLLHSTPYRRPASTVPVCKIANSIADTFDPGPLFEALERAAREAYDGPAAGRRRRHCSRYRDLHIRHLARCLLVLAWRARIATGPFTCAVQHLIAITGYLDDRPGDKAETARRGYCRQVLGPAHEFFGVLTDGHHPVLRPGQFEEQVHGLNQYVPTAAGERLIALLPPLSTPLSGDQAQEDAESSAPAAPPLSAPLSPSSPDLERDVIRGGRPSVVARRRNGRRGAHRKRRRDAASQRDRRPRTVRAGAPSTRSSVDTDARWRNRPPAYEEALVQGPSSLGRRRGRGPPPAWPHPPGEAPRRPDANTDGWSGRVGNRGPANDTTCAVAAPIVGRPDARLRQVKGDR